MVNGISIRPATPDDADIIAHHRRAMFDAMRGPIAPEDMAAMDATFVPYVRRSLADGSYRGWLACTDDGGAVAGGGLIVHEWPARPSDPNGRRAYILNVYTEPAYRRRGIAQCIIIAILEQCRAEGFKTVFLHASAHGRPLYESLGFEPTNEMRLSL